MWGVILRSPRCYHPNGWVIGAFGFLVIVLIYRFLFGFSVFWYLDQLGCCGVYYVFRSAIVDNVPSVARNLAKPHVSCCPTQKGKVASNRAES